MKKLNIIVNGTAYDVVVQELEEGEVVTPVTPVAPSQPAAPAPAQSVTPAPASGDEIKITAPMPGNMWKVFAKVGQKVKKGEVLVILEAMKMENEIMAPQDGTVLSVHVTEGAAVDTDAVLVVLG